MGIVGTISAGSLILKGKRGRVRYVCAVGDPAGLGGLKVRKGSKAALHSADGLTETYVRLRQVLIDEGIMVKRSTVCSFSCDYEFSSYGAAESVVMGGQRNGKGWKPVN